MYIKLAGENIVGHTYENISDGTGYQAQIPTQVLVELDSKSKYFTFYKFKYDKGVLVALTEQEKEAHPLYVKKLLDQKIDNLLRAQELTSTKAKYVQIKNKTLTAAEVKEVDDRIAAIDAEIADKEK